MSIVIPLATLLIGYAANYSQELENEVPLRLRLFGYHEQSMLGAKMIANLIFMTTALVIYAVFDSIFLRLQIPLAPASALIFDRVSLPACDYPVCPCACNRLSYRKIRAHIRHHHDAVFLS